MRAISQTGHFALSSTTANATSRRRPVAAGFTLVELIVTIAIVALVATLGVPSFSSSIKNGRLITEANRLVAHLQLARSEAIKRNQTVSLCSSDDGVDCGASAAAAYHQGWLVYADTSGRDDDYDTGDGDQLIQVGGAAPSGVTIRSNRSGDGWLSFKANGMLDENNFSALYVLCIDERSTESVPARLVSVALSGQPRVTTRTAGAGCSL